MDCTRAHGLKRTLTVLRYVSGLRHGVTATELAQWLRSEGYPINDRTARRDGDVLVQQGLIRKINKDGVAYYTRGVFRITFEGE